MPMTNSETFNYVFGPVPSRRLGRSLGVDLVPYKYCPLDCVYCQVGATTVKTLERQEFVPLDAVLAEIHRKLASGAAPDYITLSGSGEPTLYGRLGELIGGIKAMTSVPVAVLTNGTLLWNPEVRRELIGADLVVPSLDAADKSLFQRVNRPHPDLDLDRVIEGLIAFRAEFTHQLWLEVFLLADATDEEVERIAQCARRIQPDRVQLNTVARPPTEPSALPMSAERLTRLAALFGPNAEVIADFSATHDSPEFTATREDVLAMLKRRPCSLDDVAQGLNIHRNEASKHLGHLVESGAIRPETRGATTYYVVVST